MHRENHASAHSRADGWLERWFRYLLLFMGVSFGKRRARHELSPEELETVQKLLHALHEVAAAPALPPLLRRGESLPPIGHWRAVPADGALIKELRPPAFAALAEALLPPEIDNLYLSCRFGTKAAFLEKPALWSHIEHDAHRFPMHGLEHWRALLTVPFDPDSAIKGVEIGVPVLVDGEPAGSLVCELRYERLKQLAERGWRPVTA